MKKNKKSQKTKKKKKPSNFYKYIIIFLLIVIAALGGFLASYVYMQKEFKKEIKKQQSVIKTLEKKITKLEKETKKIPPPPKIVKAKNYNASESEDYILALKQIKNTPKKHITHNNKIIKKPKKPLLVIIIDDMSFKNQVRELKSIPLKITPSFFPPTKRHPNTAIYAKNFSHYMVHVPMQALHFNKPEPNTLTTNDDYHEIKQRIDYIKKLFPKAKFINNHTGSKFTADTTSMKYLFKALKADHLGFVDSKTTPLSKSAIAEKYYKIPLFSRNIFLDNKPEIPYIKNQLKKAVQIAQKKGYAIAIGHPHKTTFLALKNSQNILKNVKVVYIDELEKYTH
jgi:polysaccharide deacetylase 2 family uncharacterized protein YibQ/cell division protein FtsB